MTSKFKTNDVKKAKAIEVNIYGGKLINLGLNIIKFILFLCSTVRVLSWIIIILISTVFRFFRLWILKYK